MASISRISPKCTWLSCRFASSAAFKRSSCLACSALSSSLLFSSLFPLVVSALLMSPAWGDESPRLRSSAAVTGATCLSAMSSEGPRKITASSSSVGTSSPGDAWAWSSAMSIVVPSASCMTGAGSPAVAAAGPGGASSSSATVGSSVSTLPSVPGRLPDPCGPDAGPGAASGCPPGLTIMGTDCVRTASDVDGGPAGGSLLMSKPELLEVVIAAFPRGLSDN
mmetsp:Transcript_17104/g.42447  ORF Transcript_17104/g.42447 Transcript_17104/m.42447 type:complete len:223 (+) Transcript_17104:1346-2014(+)